MKRKIGFVLASIVFIPMYILKIPWYILVWASHFDEKTKDIYLKMEAEAFSED